MEHCVTQVSIASFLLLVYQRIVCFSSTLVIDLVSQVSGHQFYKQNRNKVCFKCSKVIMYINFKKKPSRKTQCPEMILNKTAKTLNKTYTGLMGFLQRFQICFFSKS